MKYIQFINKHIQSFYYSYQLYKQFLHPIQSDNYSIMTHQKKNTVLTIAKEYYQNVENVKIQPSQLLISDLYSLTNDVYKVTDGKNKTILVKMYQRALEQFADSTLETKLVSRLSQEHYYPKVLFSNEHYRIERFINSIEISPSTISEENVMKIVKTLAQYSCDYNQFVMKYIRDHQLRQKYNINELENTFQKIYQRKVKQCPELVRKCQQYFSKTYGNENVMNKLRKMLTHTQQVLSHNDMHLGNVLIEEGNVYLLDYEFSGFNYLGFDIGNFLNEWMTEYGEHTFEIREDLQMSKQLKKKVVQAYFGTLKKCYLFKSSSKDLEIYVQLGRTLSHLFWLTVGLRQIDDKRIGFDMVYYIRRRSQQFTKNFNILDAMLQGL